jgi:hypothetical protein
VDAYVSTVAQANATADKALLDFYLDLLQGQKLTSIYALTGKATSLSDLPRGLQYALNSQASKSYRGLGFASAADAQSALQQAGNLRLVPFVTFSLYFKNARGEYEGAQASLLVPPFKEVDP